ncbi:hypothetical protein BTA30_01050 [Bacillus swezeyi]|uniref:Uncharacterized protein n=1 Tax=Bacillus swezeyi TaxID=1925020 RepID=A0A1R1QM83_9BACI|nr:hypothetical protein BW143_09990 [Bacillus swezeyi]OMI32823.1 hypothetical protein BTA30_01050 [Bacillus swezeyi]
MPAAQTFILQYDVVFASALPHSPVGRHIGFWSTGLFIIALKPETPRNRFGVNTSSRAPALYTLPSNAD